MNIDMLAGLALGAIATGGLTLLAALYHLRALLCDEQKARLVAEERARRAESLTVALSKKQLDLTCLTNYVKEMRSTLGAELRACLDHDCADMVRQQEREASPVMALLERIETGLLTVHADVNWDGHRTLQELVKINEKIENSLKQQEREASPMVMSHPRAELAGLDWESFKRNLLRLGVLDKEVDGAIERLKIRDSGGGSLAETVTVKPCRDCGSIPVERSHLGMHGLCCQLDLTNKSFANTPIEAARLWNQEHGA